VQRVKDEALQLRGLSPAADSLPRRAAQPSSLSPDWTALSPWLSGSQRRYSCLSLSPMKQWQLSGRAFHAFNGRTGQTGSTYSPGARRKHSTQEGAFIDLCRHQKQRSSV